MLTSLYCSNQGIAIYSYNIFCYLINYVQVCIGFIDEEFNNIIMTLLAPVLKALIHSVNKTFHRYTILYTRVIFTEINDIICNNKACRDLDTKNTWPSLSSSWIRVFMESDAHTLYYIANVYKHYDYLQGACICM